MERRKFNQGAVVLMTLANRPAWAQTATPECVSANAWVSIAAGMSLNPAENDFALRSQLEGVYTDPTTGDVCLGQQPNQAMEADQDESIRYASKLVRQRSWLTGGPLWGRPDDE